MHCGKARRANPRYGQRPAPKEKDIIKYRNLFDRKTELNIRGVNLTQARLLYLRLFIAACELFGVRRVLSRVIAAKEGKPHQNYNEYFYDLNRFEYPSSRSRVYQIFKTIG